MCSMKVFNKNLQKIIKIIWELELNKGDKMRTPLTNTHIQTISPLFIFYAALAAKDKAEQPFYTEYRRSLSLD